MGYFFQVVNNACATLAVLNGLCNIPSLPMGQELTDLIAFTAGMDPQVCLMTCIESLRPASLPTAVHRPHNNVIGLLAVRA
jgi:Ubiquitin carboxyl-terminal hydrolase, family 1